MKIHIHEQVYKRVKDVAQAQDRTNSDLIQDALIQYLGLEGMPLNDDDEVYGNDGKKNKSKSVT